MTKDKSTIEAAVKEGWCAVKDMLVIWPNAQRSLRPAHVQALIEGFDPELLDPVHVSAVVKAPNYRHLIDGHHRKTVVEELFGSNEQIRCMIHEDCKTAARAAEIFRQINKSRKAPTAVEDFKVAVEAGSEVHVDVDKIVRKSGYHVNKGDGKAVSAVQSLLHVHSRYGARALDAALRMLRDTWPDDHHALEGPMIVGFGALIFDHPKIDRERLMSRINKKFSPGTLLAAAKALKQASAKSISLEIKQVLINHYNVGLRDAQKLANEKDGKAASERPFRGHTNGGAPENGQHLNARNH